LRLFTRVFRHIQRLGLWDIDTKKYPPLLENGIELYVNGKGLAFLAFGLLMLVKAPSKKAGKKVAPAAKKAGGPSKVAKVRKLQSGNTRSN